MYTNLWKLLRKPNSLNVLQSILVTHMGFVLVLCLTSVERDERETALSVRNVMKEIVQFSFHLSYTVQVDRVYKLLDMCVLYPLF